MATFSSGPWEARIGAITSECQAVVMAPDPEEGHRRVCVVDSHTGRFTRGGRFVADPDCPIRDANAELIADAPTMLELLRRIVKSQCDAEAIREASELIARH